MARVRAGGGRDGARVSAPTSRPSVIIDDAPDLRDLLRITLESGGFDVVAEAGDGRTGIEAASAQPPDVILLDLTMPVMDGLEALPALRAGLPATPGSSCCPGSAPAR